MAVSLYVCVVLIAVVYYFAVAQKQQMFSEEEKQVMFCAYLMKSKKASSLNYFVQISTLIYFSSPFPFPQQAMPNATHASRKAKSLSLRLKQALSATQNTPKWPRVGPKANTKMLVEVRSLLLWSRTLNLILWLPPLFAPKALQVLPRAVTS